MRTLLIIDKMVRICRQETQRRERQKKRQKALSSLQQVVKEIVRSANVNYMLVRMYFLTRVRGGKHDDVCRVKERLVSHFHSLLCSELFGLSPFLFLFLSCFYIFAFFFVFFVTISSTSRRIPPWILSLSAQSVKSRATPTQDLDRSAAASQLSIPPTFADSEQPTPSCEGPRSFSLI